MNKEHRFKGQMTPPTESAKVAFDIKFRIVPDKEARKTAAHSTGKIFISVPGGQDAETQHLVHAILIQIQEKLEFPDATLRIDGGFVFGKLLPETDEERAEVGDKTNFARLQLVEVPRHLPELGAQQLTIGSSPIFLVLLSQFNQARRGTNAVDRYLGFFKVLEKAYAAGRGGNLLRALQESKQLLEIASNVLPKENVNGSDSETWNELLKTLVRVRDNCAHLRGKTGYLPHDTRIPSEVEPFTNLVAVLAKATVEIHREST